MTSYFKRSRLLQVKLRTFNEWQKLKTCIPKYLVCFFSRNSLRNLISLILVRYMFLAWLVCNQSILVLIHICWTKWRSTFTFCLRCKEYVNVLCVVFKLSLWSGFSVNRDCELTVGLVVVPPLWSLLNDSYARWTRVVMLHYLLSHRTASHAVEDWYWYCSDYGRGGSADWTRMYWWSV